MLYYCIYGNTVLAPFPGCLGTGNEANTVMHVLLPTLCHTCIIAMLLETACRRVPLPCEDEPRVRAVVWKQWDAIQVYLEQKEHKNCRTVQPWCQGYGRRKCMLDESSCPFFTWSLSSLGDETVISLQADLVPSNQAAPACTCSGCRHVPLPCEDELRLWAVVVRYNSGIPGTEGAWNCRTVQPWCQG